MGKSWPVHVVDRKEKFEEWISADRREIIYRGQARADWPLQAGLDRISPTCFTDYRERLEDERRCMESFTKEAYRFLGHIERGLVARYPQGESVGLMTVMQHFGAPTRLLDWTWSRAACAYFACIEEHDHDGAIWWVSSKAIRDSVDPHWERRGFTRRPKQEGERDGGVSLESGIFNPEVEEFVSMVYLTVLFPRAEAQRALFTIGSRLGMDHAPALARQVDTSLRGKVVIKADVKRHVIAYLERLGMDAVALRHTGADRIGLRMSWERRSGLSQLTQEPENAER